MQALNYAVAKHSMMTLEVELGKLLKKLVQFLLPMLPCYPSWIAQKKQLGQNYIPLTVNKSRLPAGGILKKVGLPLPRGIPNKFQQLGELC